MPIHTYTYAIISSRQSPPFVDDELDRFQRMLPAFPLLQILTLVVQRSFIGRDSGRSLHNVNLDWNPAVMPALRRLRFWSDKGIQPYFKCSRKQHLERLEIHWKASVEGVASRLSSEHIQQKLEAMPICDELVDHNILRQCSSYDADDLFPPNRTRAPRPSRSPSSVDLCEIV
jgi:hypothetical protein